MPFSKMAFEASPPATAAVGFPILFRAHTSPLTQAAAFAGLFYLSIYLAAKMHVLDSKGEVWKTFVVLIPTLGAALIAGSRIMDARHHPFDVISGSMLGILVAWASYRQYFPPVTEPWKKGRAYPIRSWGKEPLAPVPMAPMPEDVQPLRPLPADIERGAASGYSSPTAVPGSSDDHGGNVFRAQISASQRRREGDPYNNTAPTGYNAPQRGPSNLSASTTTSTYTSTLPASNPFVSSRGPQHDAYQYSSSEDDDSYELQPTYTLSNPHGAGAYDPVNPSFGADTSYHAQAVSPVPPPPPAAGARKPLALASHPADGSGDLGEHSVDPPQPPQHAPGTTTGDERGVQLVETYAK
jgi:hypothetical protein